MKSDAKCGMIIDTYSFFGHSADSRHVTVEMTRRKESATHFRFVLFPSAGCLSFSAALYVHRRSKLGAERKAFALFRSNAATAEESSRIIRTHALYFGRIFPKIYSRDIRD